MNTKSLRNHYGVSQKELARAFNIPVKTIQSWEYKNNMPEYVWNILNTALSYIDSYQKAIHDSDEVKDVLEWLALNCYNHSS